MKKGKGYDEEEYALPLERESGCPAGTLRGRLKEGMRKVASKPGPEERAVVGSAAAMPQ